MTLLQMSFSGAVLVLVILCIRTLTVARLPKRTFLILWMLVLLRLLVPFTISSPFSVYTLLYRNIFADMWKQTPIGSLVKETPVGKFVAASPSIQTDAISPSTATVSDPPPVLPNEQFKNPTKQFGNAFFELPEEQAHTTLSILPAGSSSPSKVKDPGTQLQAAAHKPTDWIKPFPLSRFFLLFLYFTGASLCAAFFLFSYARCQLEFRTALPVSDPGARQWLKQWIHTQSLRRTLLVRQSDRIDAPLTYGILHPVILLPKNIDWKDTASLQFILAHETIHIRRLDAVTKLLTVLALCLHWFNPLVWVMYFLFNRDLELACDEQVILEHGETCRAAYAHMLLDMEARKSGLIPLYHHFSKTAIEERITTIMKVNKYSRLAILPAAGLIIAVTAVFATSATYTAAAEPAISSAQPLRTLATQSVQKDSAMPDSSFTREEYDALFAMQFDGYMDMTITTYQNKAWNYMDTPEHLALMERFSQSKILEELRYENKTASFLHNIYNALTAEQWKARDFDGYTTSAPAGSSHDTAVLEYTFTLNINDPDSLTVREYNAARSGMMEGLHCVLENLTTEQLRNEAYMNQILPEKIHALQSAFCSDTLEVSVDYSYMPPDSNDNETAYLAASERIVQNQQQILVLQEELSILMNDLICHAQANLDHTTQLETALLPYAPFGLSWKYNPINDDYKIYFQGKEVRGIWDAQTGTYITEHVGISTYAEDAIELATVYANGKLTGLRIANGQETQEMTVLRQHTTDSMYTDREPRINDYADEEDYRSLFTLMTPDYTSYSLTEFNSILLDWANVHVGSYERILEDFYRKDYFQEEPSISLTKEQSRFVAMTIMLSDEENRRQLQAARTGKPEEDPLFRSYRLYKTDAEGLLWCGFDYSFHYHIAEKNIVTVGERDRLVGNVIDAIEAFWAETNLETLQTLTREDVLAKLEDIAFHYSNHQITFTIPEEQLYFEHMDERTFRATLDVPALSSS